jgi:hypothetical protein
MTKREKLEQAFVREFSNRVVRVQRKPKPFTADDIERIKRAAIKVKPILDKAEKEGRLYGNH